MMQRTTIHPTDWRQPALLVAMLTLAACATSPTTTKGDGALEPFADAGATDKATDGDRYALVVGIDQFEDKKFNDLKYALRDAQAVGDALEGFSKVLRLTDPDETDRTDILEALTRLEKLADAPSDTVFVYFSTHGTLAREPGGDLKRYLVARDTRLDVAASTGLGVSDVLSTLEDFASERTALVLATCHSGSGKSAISDALANALARRKSPTIQPLRDVSEATIMLSASAFEEPARETEKLEHDVYTYFFLEGLKRGDRDGNGAVTVSEAHDYARQRTYAYTDGAQRPTAWSSVLSGRPDGTARPVVYSYRRSAEGLEMSVDGQTKGALPGGVALEPGRHRVKLTDGRTGRTVWRGTVRLSAGERLEVVNLIPPPSALEIRAAGGALLPF
ncbi:MAG: caspase domain-containing protein, partial [Bradymonadaceae bacterium]